MSTDRIRVGLIGKPFGLNGHVTVRVESDDPERFAVGSVFPGPDGSEIEVDDRREAERGILLRFRGYETRELAETLRGHELTIDPAERRSLGEDEFWPDDLVGLDAVTPDGDPIGVVSACLEGAAQWRLVVGTASGESVEVPFVTELVPDVDLSGRTVTIVPIPGLIEP